LIDIFCYFLSAINLLEPHYTESAIRPQTALLQPLRFAKYS